MRWDPAWGVPPGRIVKTRTADFMEGAAPAWLTAPSGTLTFGNPATTRGWAQIATAAARNATASVQSELAVHTGQIEAIRFDVDGYTPTQHNPLADIFIDFRDAAGDGVYLVQYRGDVYARLGVSTDAAGSEQLTPLDLRGGPQPANLTPRNIGLMFQCRTREMFLYCEDSVVGYRDIGGTEFAGTVRPRLTIVNQDPEGGPFSSKSLRGEQLRQTVWTI